MSVRQRGSALLPGVLMLLALALMMLGAQIPRDAFLRRYALYERYGMTAWQHAHSALEQGAQMAWLPSVNWQCRSTTLPAQVCVRLSARKGRALMRAHSAPLASGPRITLFRYFSVPEAEQAQTLLPLARGWIDYCPEPQEALCR